MKKSLLLLHGALGAAEQFKNWPAQLSSQFEVHTFDFEGHGPRAAERPFRMEHFAENIISFLDENGLEQVALFGYSMGGYAALTAALQHADRFSGIFTLGTKFAWDPASSAREVKMLNADVIAEKIPKFAQALEARHSGIGWREHLKHTADMMVALGESPILTPEKLATIQIPVRITLGDRDNMVSLEESAAAFKSLPQSQFQVFPETQHPIERVSAARIAQALGEFFGV